jgi:hypothetical protein
MRLIATIVVQVLLAFVVAASVMPVLLATVPDVQDERVGGMTAAAIFVVSFVLIAMVWPGRKSKDVAKADRR